MRIVIDTNVLIAALTRPGGNAARVVEAWREGRLEVIASEATLCEAELVLGAGWLARVVAPGEVSALLERLRSRSVRVGGRPVTDLPLKDEGDLRLVQAALAGGAAYLVTTDREVLRHRGYAGVEFVTPAELSRQLRGRRS